MDNSRFSRRNFIAQSGTVAIAAGLTSMSGLDISSSPIQSNDSINFIGPKDGYTPQIGTLVSMMNWMRTTILRPIDGLSVKDLDYLHDDDSNSIGAMLLHLAATERFYQLNTFEGRTWGDWPEADASEFNVGMSLGDNARKSVKGNNAAFYLEKLERVREHSLKELAKRDDEWLLAIDEEWMWNAPTNNYCKWFHVVEHESNHNGQIKYIKSRIS